MSKAAFIYPQILIIGGTSQTGRRLIQEFLINDTKINLIATSRGASKEKNMPIGDLAFTLAQDLKNWGKKVSWCGLDLDTDNPKTLSKQLSSIEKKIDFKRPLCLILSAAFTNVDGCETDFEKCKRFNITNTRAVMEWAKQKNDNLKIVFYSTDYVFDGKSGPYLEDVSYSALSKYGESKVVIEEKIQAISKNFLIIRTTGVFDYLKGSKNFLMQMIRLWSEGVVTKIPSDQSSNPTWAKDLAYGTVELIKQDAKGIFNIAGAEVLARDEFAKKIAEIFNLDASYVQSIQTSELNQKAARPLAGGLKLEKIKKAIGWVPHTATEALQILYKDYLDQQELKQ